MICIKNIVKGVFFVSLLFSCSSDNDGNNNNDNPTNTTENSKPTGTSANQLLASDRYNKLIVEIVSIEGFSPTENTITAFQNFLDIRLHKPQGIEVIQRSIKSPEKSTYTIQDIIQLEMRNRTKYNTDNQIAVFAFFADGDSSQNTENSSVLGAAYRNTSFVIFEKTLKEFSQGTFAPSLQTLETTVINHEFGHLIGLVNAGTPLQSNHQDTDHGKHCTVDDCLMFYTAETGEGLIDMFSGGRIPVLDPQCIADLQANGGK